jgi:spermidine/putrescine transport system permease protein
MALIWAPLTLVLARGAQLEGLRILLERPEIWEAFVSSLGLALVSALAATLIGACAAALLPRLTGWTSRLLGAGLLFPMLLPEIALGLSLLVWFIQLGMPLGWMTLGLGHLAFSVSYATLVLKGHFEIFDRSILEAVRDLGGGRWSVLRHAIWPQIFPGLVAAFFTAFGLSLDDFLVTFFVKGIDQMTLPVRIYGMIKVRLGPEIYSLSLLLFCISVTAVLLSQTWALRRQKVQY